MITVPSRHRLAQWIPRKKGVPRAKGAVPLAVPGDQGPVTLENRTARRIAIAQRDGKGEFQLGPFETLELQPEYLESLDINGWKRRNLILVRDRPDPAPSPERAGWLLLVLAGLVLSAALLQVDDSGRTLMMAMGVALLMVLASQLKMLVRAVASSLTFLLVGLVGFGLPAVPLALWVEKTSLSGHGLRQSLFLQVLWWLFIGLASVLPAALYFLFARIKMQTLRESFLRDVVRMNPSIDTMDDANVLYGPRVDELYGQQDSPLGAHLPLLISTLLITLGWLTVAPPSGLAVASGEGSPIPTMTVTSTSFLGAYFFILQMLFRRYVRSDLGPKAYTHVTLRVLCTTVLAWMLGLLPGSAAGGSTGVLVLAFFTGIVPDTAFVVLQDFLRSTLIFKDRIHALTERCPLSDLEGITLYDRARFLEEGVENVENLAHHSLIDLMLWTRMPTPRLLDLVDQSILYLHVVNPRLDSSGRENEKSLPDDLGLLRRYGLRTATDLLCAYKLYKDDPKQRDALLGLLDAGDEKGPPRLKVIHDVMVDDDWVCWLTHWHQRTQLALKVHSLEDFSLRGHRTLAPEPDKVAPTLVKAA